MLNFDIRAFTCQNMAIFRNTSQEIVFRKVIEKKIWQTDLWIISVQELKGKTGGGGVCSVQALAV